ncbi:hypothetical protein GCM10009795_011540 [Nocardioides hankookensis]
MLILAACGVPDGGDVRTVDRDAVPYRLLESDQPSPAPTTGAITRATAPAVFWVDGDRLLPEATADSCTSSPSLLVEHLLTSLTTGPSEEARAAGRSSALPTDFVLHLVAVRGGTAEVDIDPGASLSAEQLPLAVAQVVLTVTTAPAVEAVTFVDDGEQVRAPMPGGVLTEGPVRPGDYEEFLPTALRPAESLGCPAP